MEFEHPAETLPQNRDFERIKSSDNPSWWKDINSIFPVGLFTLSYSDGTVKLNPVLREIIEHAGGDVTLIGPNNFWESLEGLARDPVKTHQAIVEALVGIRDYPVIELSLKADSLQNLIFHLFPLYKSDSPEQNYGGFVINRSVERKAQLNQVTMLGEMSKEARKLGTAIQGNLGALAGNLQTWSADVISDFLEDARQQIVQLNKSLDLSLNLIHIFKAAPVFKEEVNLHLLLDEVIEKQELMDIRFVKQLEPDRISRSVFVDPVITRFAIETFLTEVLLNNPSGKQIEVSISDLEDSFVLNLESPVTLSLPGLVQELEEFQGANQNIKLFLAKRIIEIQGGSIKLYHVPPEGIGGLKIQVILPLVIPPLVPQQVERIQKNENQHAGRVLLAESQPEYQIRLREGLQALGYRVDLAVDGSAALDMVQTINPDLVVLARDLPGVDGFIVAQGIRRWSTVPIIMVSARTNPDDMLQAYQLGVDDYLTKPFLQEVLFAKIQVCLRRNENTRQPFTAEIVHQGDVRINISTRQVWIHGKPVELTPIEFNLLAYISRQRRQIIPYEQLLENVWDGPEKGTRQGLFVHVRRLREKIELDPKNPQIISNKWGVGYVFNP
ncbi:MAG: response regulator [Anaerolineales bacterium]|nr:response regulator [Anaerolineales bacterium]